MGMVRAYEGEPTQGLNPSLTKGGMGQCEGELASVLGGMEELHMV